MCRRDPRSVYLRRECPSHRLEKILEAQNDARRQWRGGTAPLNHSSVAQGGKGTSKGCGGSAASESGSEASQSKSCSND
eukprot:11179078-Karenia_brevis.AAC.1